MPVPLLTIKEALKIDYDEDDRELLRLREAATALIERKTQLGLCVREHVAYLRKMTEVLFPWHPLVSVSSVKYTSDGTLVTMPATEYWLDKTDRMPILRFLETHEPDDGTMIEVTYTAGYSEIPAELVRAIVSLVEHWYNNPGASTPAALTETPLGLQFILSHLSTGSMIR